MTCPVCGNVMNEGVLVCSSCGATITVPQNPENRMFGFGKALCSAILGDTSIFFAYLAMILATNTFGIVVGVVFALLALPLAIISLVMGLRSIQCYNKRSASNCAKPIPTLILGIAGVVMGVLGLLLVLISVFLLIMASMI